MIELSCLFVVELVVTFRNIIFYSKSIGFFSEVSCNMEVVRDVYMYL